MIPAELLRKKRDGRELSPEEIRFFIRGVVDGSISSAQAGAFLMAACTRGLSAVETGALTMAMAASGERYDFLSIAAPRIDKHSTGGVGDKLSLLLVPLLAACGVAVPMMSGRGLGHTGGTVDKLESVVGFRMDYSLEELKGLLERNHCFMIKQTVNVAPADGILYALRDVTGTVESTGLITASILSKKLVEDIDGLVLDMKVGKGAFMQTIEQAHELAESMLMVAREVGLGMRILFTRMDEPLGYAVGNWIEMVESKESLRDYEAAPPDIRELTEALAARMLCLAYKNDDIETALAQIQTVWQSGKGYEYFLRMIEAQEGDWVASEQRYAEVFTHTVRAWKDGVVSAFTTRELGVAGIELGAGRKVQTDSIDYAAGFIFHKKTGDEVREGDEIVRIQASSPEKLERVAALVKSCIEIGEETLSNSPRILEEWKA